mgnify:FL=1
MTKPKDTKIVSLADEAQLERLLYEACRAGGMLFAKTERDVAMEERRQAKESIELPEELKDPEHVWNRARTPRERPKLTPLVDQETRENLARAARFGASIPKEIEEQMHRDREMAEKESKR